MKDNVIQLNSSEKNFTDTIEDFPNRDWIEAGIKILREKSVAALTSKSISEEIKKEEKEFSRLYNGIESYMEALLDYWYEKETLKYIDMLDEMTGDAADLVLAMTEIIHNIDKSDEIAIRNMALKCPNAHAALARVDRTRLDVAIGLFKEMGFSEKESEIRSKIFYTSEIGTEYTSISSSLEQKIARTKLLMVGD
ncbi:MAG: hypothetical protein P8H57_00965 [Emcibacteraceae bacterium]|nr:hypothetical protein [Emcibacteraceae bacterium]MDG1725699.1 hypothetical protein [Emcibacteraceae bacterium]